MKLSKCDNQTIIIVIVQSSVLLAHSEANIRRITIVEQCFGAGSQVDDDSIDVCVSVLALLLTFLL